MTYRYRIDGVTGTVEASDPAEADMMVREIIEVKLEPEDKERGDR